MSGFAPPNPLSYAGQVAIPSINRPFPPTTSFNDFNVPTIWTDTLNMNAYVLVSKSLGIANWILIGGVPGALNTITTPDSTVVVPSAGNIDFLNGTGMNITGSGNNITFNSSGSVPVLFTADAGSATPSGNNLNILGGSTGLTTSGAGATISLTGTLNVAHGGTGDTSLTAYSVLCGGTTSTNPVQSVVSLGTTGQVLTSNGAAMLPTWQTNSNGNVSGPGSSTDRAISTWNGTGGNALFDNSTTKIDSSGRFTNSGQTAFTAHVSTPKTSVTGDGTTYTILFEVVDFDQGSNYNTGTGIFTAPISGKYLFTTCVSFSSVGGAHTSLIIQIFTPGINYELFRINPSAISVSGQVTFSAFFSINLTATDDVKIIVTVAGGTKTVDIQGTPQSFFGGYLIC